MNETPDTGTPGPLDTTVPMEKRPPVQGLQLMPQDPTLIVAQPSRPTWEAPGDAIGPYRLVSPLGEGGFGTVWRAEQREPIHREVALKVIKLGMDSREIIARFEAERQALALMDHPNIAAVLDAGTTETGRPFFAMELVKGAPITSYCDAQRLGIRERLELFIPVCQAVQHAHQKAILHRDLKPSNILVTEVDGKPVPKVIDFGIAKALQATAEPVLHATLARTLDGMIVGTPQYMSPEQAGSVPDVDTRSDIYTLGVILHELLVGETPLSGEKMKRVAMDEVLRWVRDEEARRPSSRVMPATDATTTVATLRQTEPRRLGLVLRGDLDWIVLRALEKDRARRYDTAMDLALDLRRHLDDEPVSAGPPSASYRLRKLVRRNRTVFVAAAAIFVMLVVGVTVSAMQTFRALNAEKFAKGQAELATAGQARAEKAENQSRQQLKEASRIAVGMALEERYEKEEVSTALAHLVKAISYAPDSTRAQMAAADLLLRAAGKLPALPERELLQCKGPPAAPAFSSDGERIAVALDGATIQVWDLISGKPVGEPMRFTEVNPATVMRKIHYGTDGSRLVAFTGDGWIGAWSVETSRPIGPRFRGRAPFTACSPDGRRVLVAPDFNAPGAQIVDTTTGQAVGKPIAHEEDIMGAEFSQDGTQIMTWSLKDKSVRIWDSGTGEQVGEPLRHVYPADAAYLSPGGRWMVTRSGGFCYRWNLESRQAVRLGQGNAADSVSWIKFNRDGRMFATISSRQSAAPPSQGTQAGVQIRFPYSWEVRVWETETGTGVGKPLVHDKAVTATQFSPDGRMLLTVAGEWNQRQGGDVRIWEASTGRLLAGPFNLKMPVIQTLFSPDMRRFVTASWSGKRDGAGFLHLWDLGSGWPEGMTLRHESEVMHDSFDESGRQMVTVTDDGVVQVFEAESGRLRGKPFRLGSSTAPDPTGRKYPAMAAFSRDGRRILTSIGKGTGSNVVQMWDIESGHKLGKDMVHDGLVLYAVYSPDDRLVMTIAGGDGPAMMNRAKLSLKFWDAASGDRVSEMPLPEGLAFEPIFSPDGTAVALSPGTEIIETTKDGKKYRSTNGDRGVEVLLVPSGKAAGPKLAHNAGDSRWKVSFSPDNSRLLTILRGLNPAAQIWDIKSGSPVGVPMEHTEPVEAAAFRPDGVSVLTGSNDRLARLWDASSGKLLATTPLQEGRVVSVGFTHDGRIIRTSCQMPGDVVLTRLWNADDLEAICQYSKVRFQGSENSARHFRGHVLGSGPWMSVMPESDLVCLMESLATVPTLTPFPRSWLEVLEAIGGTSILPSGAVHKLSVHERLKLAALWQQLRTSEADLRGASEWIKLIDWCLAPRHRRTISPSSIVTLAEYVDRELAWASAHPSDAASSLVRQQCYELYPGHQSLKTQPLEGTSPDRTRKATADLTALAHRVAKARVASSAVPQNLDAAHELCLALLSHGDALLDTGDVEAAASIFLETFARAEETHKSLRDDDDQSNQSRAFAWFVNRSEAGKRLNQVSLVLSRLTSSLRAGNDLNGALQACRQFVKVMDVLATEVDPNSINWRWGRSISYAQLAAIEELRQDSKAAEAALNKALELCAPMLQSGEVPKPYEGLADSYRKRLEVLRGKLPQQERR